MVDKSIKEPSQESKKAEPREYGSAKSKYIRDVTYEEVLKYGISYESLHKEWMQYFYDLRTATSMIEHRTGYISEDMYGLCTRTIKKCRLEMNKLEKEIDKYESKR